MIRLPRNAQIWLPGVMRGALRRRDPSDISTVWFMVADHYEPRWQQADLETARSRVDTWHRQWPRVAEAHPDDDGRPAQYTFFYPQEEYHPSLLEPLAHLTHRGLGDVEVHIHHDREGEAWFVDTMSRYLADLRTNHGLLRTVDDRTVFGFVHGNWALDNAHPQGIWCGLDNEITLLRSLGCYADFTLPAAPDPCQVRRINSIYWAVDDPTRSRSHEDGIPVVPGGTRPASGLLMVQGPLGLRWPQDRRPFPALEVGELAGNLPVTADRVRTWLNVAPSVGEHLVVKVHAHGAPEKNAGPLLERDLPAALSELRRACGEFGWKLRHATAWDIAQAIEALSAGDEPLQEGETNRDGGSFGS